MPCGSGDLPPSLSVPLNTNAAFHALPFVDPIAHGRSLAGTTSWAASPVLLLGAALPLWQSGSSLTVRLQFLPAQYGGPWAIDDVYVDPYSK